MENSPTPDPRRLGEYDWGFFHGVLAPLLIHGALAALGLVIGSAIYRQQGRQIFLVSSALDCSSALARDRRLKPGRPWPIEK